MNDLCETFRYQSGRVWNRMGKAPTVGMSLSEETFTETALYEIALEHQGTGDINITIATKPSEARHGADWEWWLVKGKVGLSFRVQAKRLFPNGRYQSLLKAPPNQYAQPHKLVAASLRDGHVPLYCFFNFHHNSSYFDNWNGQCQHSYRGPSFWGCSLATPENVLAAGSNSFRDLRSVMYPWHKLVCDRRNRRSLIDAALDFFSETQRPTFIGTARRREITTRPVPEDVIRLIESKGRSVELNFLDYTF